MGREGIVHKSAIDIMDLFEKQLQGATASSSSGKVEVSKPAEMSMVSLGQSYDPLWLAQQKMELKMGNIYQHKDQLWKLVSLDRDNLGFEAASLFAEGEMELPTASCHKELKLHKGPVPSILEKQVAASRLPSTLCAAEQKQASLFICLLKAAHKLEPKGLWELVGIEPASKKLYSLQKLKAGQLTLVPVTDSCSKVTSKPPTKGSKHGVLTSEGTDYFVLPPKLFKPATATAPDDGTTAPFWYVQSSKTPNLALQPLDSQGCTINCLVNSKAIRKHQLLSMPEILAEPLPTEPSKKKAKKQ